MYEIDQSPRKVWAPRSLSPEGQRVMNELINLAVDNSMISHTDGERARVLIRANPSEQLSLLGSRMEALKRLVNDSKSLDTRLSTAVETTDKSLRLLESFLGETRDA